MRRYIIVIEESWGSRVNDKPWRAMQWHAYKRFLAFLSGNLAPLLLRLQYILNVFKFLSFVKSLSMPIDSLLTTLFFLRPKAYLSNPQNVTKVSQIFRSQYGPSKRRPIQPPLPVYREDAQPTKKGQVNNVLPLRRLITPSLLATDTTASKTYGPHMGHIWAAHMRPICSQCGPYIECFQKQPNCMWPICCLTYGNIWRKTNQHNYRPSFNIWETHMGRCGHSRIESEHFWTYGQHMGNIWGAYLIWSIPRATQANLSLPLLLQHP